MKLKVKAVKRKNDGTFNTFKIPQNVKKRENDIDLNQLYERAINELGLQQSKRDQLLTIYLAMFSFLIPFALSLKIISWQVKGYIFLATAIIGILFADIIIRYRVYKEVYWLCCQTITILFGVKRSHLSKAIIQQCYRITMDKKCNKYVTKKQAKQKNESGNPIVTKKFNKLKYIKDNVTSSEFVYFVIHGFVTALIFGLSLGLILPFGFIANIVIATAAALVLILIFICDFFARCMKVYRVLVDDKKASFNYAFSKAWFLHFYLDDDYYKKESTDKANEPIEDSSQERAADFEQQFSDNRIGTKP